MKLVFFVIIISLYSQDINTIKSSDAYYWGEAVSENQNEASDRALSGLSKQISVTVSSSFKRVKQEDNESLRKNTESILKTYSMAKLRDVKRISRAHEDGIYVFHYIRKADVKKIFDERKRMAMTFYENGKFYEAEGNIKDALKHYYYGVVLTASIPEESVDFQGLNLSVHLNKAINTLISSLSFEIIEDQLISDKERHIRLAMKSRGLQVFRLSFYYWADNQQVELFSKQGEALIRLYSADVKMKELKLKIKYDFYEEREQFPVINSLWDIVLRPKYKNSYTVNLDKKSKKKREEKTIIFPENCDVSDQIKQNYQRFRKAVKEKKWTGRIINEQFKKLILYNNTSLAGREPVHVIKTKQGWEIRGIKVQNYYPHLRKKTNEFLNLDFNKNGELNWLSFSVVDNLYKKYVGTAKDKKDFWKRQTIVKFLERYRMAYMTRDMDMVEKIFSDDALIIIGKKIKSIKSPDMGYNPIGNQPDYEYIRLNKKSYLKRLATVFKSANDIYLDFSTFKIIKRNKDKGVYGVSMRQNYSSNNYSDEGHLFLLIDFNSEDPKIYVRSWQPQEWDEDKLIGLANFKIY